MKDFDSDWRRKQEVAGRPYADAIYKEKFPDVERITRLDGHQLDRRYGVDVVLRFPNGMILAGQEKFLSAEYARHRTLTVEWYQNPKLGEEGDWFRLLAHFYFCGYFHGKGFDPWVIAWWPLLVLGTQFDQIDWSSQDNKHDGARAQFRYIPMEEIPTYALHAASWEDR